MKKVSIILLSLLVLHIEGAFSQGIDVLHFMRLNPFSTYSDPTAETIYKGYVAIPGISNIGLDLYNDALRYKDVFRVDDGGYPISINGNRMADELRERNLLALDVNAELLGFGFKIKNFFFSFDWRMRANMDLCYSKDILAFPINGNLHYLGDANPADMNLQLGLNAYQEISFSIRQTIKDKFIWGARPKLLFGVANLYIPNFDAQIFTSEDDYTMRLFCNGDATFATALPLALSIDNTNVLYEFNMENFAASDLFKNIGASIDFGFRYKISKGLSIAANVIDLGWIHWKTNPVLIHSGITDNGRYFEDGGIVFNGLSEHDIAMLRDADSRPEFLDTVAGYLDLSSESTSGYRTMLPTRFLVQCDYVINKNHRVSAVLQGRMVNRKLIPSATFAYDLNVSRFVDVCVAYTLQRNCFDNVALGLGFNMGPINLYAGTNNLLTLINNKNWSRASAYVGLVVNWGHVKKPVE